MLETFQIWSFKSLYLSIQVDFFFDNVCAAPILGLNIEAIFKQQKLELMAQKAMTEKELRLFHNMNSGGALIFSYLCFSVKEFLFKALLPILHVFTELSESGLIVWNNRSESFYLVLMCPDINSQFEDKLIYEKVWKFYKKYGITIVSIFSWNSCVFCKKFPITNSLYNVIISQTLDILENHRPSVFSISIHPNSIFFLTRLTYNKPVDINISGDD